ncbi:MAG: hypothetical protein HY682_03960 [Chloroflexi bacterium]|nr:hypothetical protein [Chloroflexota bacterium]
MLRISMRARLIALIFGVALTVVAIGCGGGEAATATSAPAAQPTSVAAATATAAPVAAPTATPPPVGGGRLVVGEDAVCPPTYIMKFVTGACFERVAMWGMMEGLTYMKPAPVPEQINDEDQAKSMVASWEVNDTAKTMTWVLKTGITFQDKRWGDVTAHDVVFSFQQAMAEGSTFNRAGELRNWIKVIEASDDRTVKIQCKDAGCQKDWIRQQSNYNGQTVSISSKKAFDELGEEKALVALGNGTGPFKPSKWTANEEIVTDAVKPHWRHTPSIDSLRYVEIPEVSVRVAAITTGEIQLADLPPRFVAQAVKQMNGKSQQIGPGTGQGIWFAGNYWATTDYLGAAGQGNDPTARPGYKPDAQHPWIGKWGDDASMERARKVREAMAMLVDRDKLNEKILGGLGLPAFSYFGWTPKHPEWKPEWKLDYDPAKAKALLAEAGYSGGFETGYWIPPDVVSVIDPEISEAIAQMWVDGGLKVKIEKTAYSARRPTLVARSIDVPWAWNQNGQDSPKDTNAVGPHVPRAGSWNSGTEFPDEIGKLWKVIEDERDPAKKRALNVQVSDWVNKWRTYANFVETTPFFAVRPEVTKWEPYTGNLPYFNSAETIVLKGK